MVRLRPLTDFRFTLRGMLLGVTAFGGVLGGYALLELTGAVMAITLVGVWLYGDGMRNDQFGKSFIGFLVMVVAGLFSLLLLFAWLHLGEGPVYFRSSWPQPLHRMAACSDHPGWTKVVCRSQHFELEYQWRLSLTPAQRDQVVRQFGWRELPAKEVPTRFWRAFPPLWQPRHRASCTYFQTKDFPAAGRGDGTWHYLAMYDPQRNELYVWLMSGSYF